MTGKRVLKKFTFLISLKDDIITFQASLLKAKFPEAGWRLAGIYHKFSILLSMIDAPPAKNWNAYSCRGVFQF